MNLSDKIEIVNVSDTGKRRPHNEDSALSDADQGLMILADGMGGYKTGEVASAIAVTPTHQKIIKGLQNAPQGPGHRESDLSHESYAVKNIINLVNSEVYNTTAQRDPQCQGMGTTIVMVLFHNNLCTIAHVGDSRMYRKRDRKFEQITKDH